MKNLKIFVFIILVGLFFQSCEKNSVQPGYPNLFANKKAAVLIESNNHFAIDFFKEMTSFATAENWMVSPLSVAMALGMTYNGAEGDTKTAFEETLRLQGLSREEINAIHGDLMRYLVGADSQVKMEIANSIWVHHWYNLRKEFADTNRYYYQAEINSIDFFSGKAEKAINDWVSQKTHEKIPQIIDAIPGDAVMYLINAIYFYGNWTWQFDKTKTSDLSFFPETGNPVSVKTMQMEADLEFYQGNSFNAIDLPYGKGNFAMTILLPHENKTTSEVSESLTPDGWNVMLKGFSKVNGMKVFLPKFTFEYDTLLNAPLISMGLGKAFSGADFSGMLEDRMSLEISRVIHKTFIGVDEEGTEAAAVTAVEMRYTSIPATPEFRVDRPFIFTIREKATGSILFMGKVALPEAE